MAPTIKSSWLKGYQRENLIRTVDKARTKEDIISLLSQATGNREEQPLIGMSPLEKYQNVSRLDHGLYYRTPTNEIACAAS